jgi:hypothetical protein
LEKKAYRPLKSEIQIRGENNGISQICILGKSAFNQEKKEEGKKKALAYSPYPD